MLPDYSHKRSCLTSVAAKPTIDLPFLLELHKNEVWALAKSDLRGYFLALQEHARSLSPVHYGQQTPQIDFLQSPGTVMTTSAPIDPPRPIPPILKLPPEVRDLIYTKLLCSLGSLSMGPHPRQLQNPLYFSQSFVPEILRTSHQIHDEALAIFYGSRMQRVHITIDYNVWTHKLQRSKFLMSTKAIAAIRHLHINVHLGSEKKASRLGKIDGDARLAVVKKGARKLGKWLSGKEIKTLTLSWREPPKTYTWEQKKDILDEFRVLRPEQCDMADLNWGLKYPGKKYQFHVEYLKDLQRDMYEKSRLELSDSMLVDW